MRVDGLAEETVTHDQGRFVLSNVPSGECWISIRAPGGGGMDEAREGNGPSSNGHRNGEGICQVMPRQAPTCRW